MSILLEIHHSVNQPARPKLGLALQLQVHEIMVLFCYVVIETTP